MSGFTPGPWGISTETRGCEICTVHGVPTQPTDDGKGQAWVYIHYQTRIDGEWYYAGANEKLANARLIASAPALLDALEELFERGHVSIALLGNPLACEALEAKCRAAIAAARGDA